MNCPISQQIAIHVNADNEAANEEVFNESASAELFIHRVANFSNIEIELNEAIDKALGDERELFLTLVERMITDDLNAKSEMRLLIAGIANQMNSER